MPSELSASLTRFLFLFWSQVEQDQMDNSSLCDFNAQRAHLKLMVVKTKKEMKEQKLLQERKELNNMQVAY